MSYVHERKHLNTQWQLVQFGRAWQGGVSSKLSAMLPTSRIYDHATSLPDNQVTCCYVPNVNAEREVSVYVSWRTKTHVQCSRAERS